MQSINNPAGTAAESTVSVEQQNAQQEAQQQMQQLKNQADQQLLQLMLEQKSRLNDMVQHLKGSETGETSAFQSNTKMVQNLPLQDLPQQQEPNVPLAEVSKLQADNLNHLDIIMNRIQHTLNAKHPEPDGAEELKGESADESFQPDF